MIYEFIFLETQLSSMPPVRNLVFSHWVNNSPWPLSQSHGLSKCLWTRPWVQDLFYLINLDVFEYFYFFLSWTTLTLYWTFAFKCHFSRNITFAVDGLLCGWGCPGAHFFYAFFGGCLLSFLRGSGYSPILDCYWNSLFYFKFVNLPMSLKHPPPSFQHCDPQWAFSTNRFSSFVLIFQMYQLLCIFIVSWIASLFL